MSSDEARTFGRYVVGREIDQRVADLYARASRELGCESHDRVAQFALRHPWSIGALDAALALTASDAPLRKKLLLMAAILETQPEYCDAFLPRDRMAYGSAMVAYALARAALLAAAGVVLLRLVR
jgi:hypothetical protein